MITTTKKILLKLLLINFLLIHTTLASATISKESMEVLLDQIKTTFSPLIEKDGSELIIKLNWDSEEKSAYSSHEVASIFLIVVNGGALRNEVMTNDSAAFLLCHEVGHILGGEPKYLPDFWASAEGQADYFAANVCLKKIFAHDDNLSIVKTLPIPASLKNICHANYINEQERALCERIGLSGYLFAEDYRRYKKIKTKLSYDVKDTTKVKELNRSYSLPQCRLDTAMAGALCLKGFNFSIEEKNKDEDINCQVQDPTNTQRPSCWFK